MTATPLASRSATFALLATLWLVPNLRGGEAPSDALLKLVPADAGAVLALDDLRGRWGEITGLQLTKSLLERPSIQAWLNSRNARDFFQARDRILGFLGTTPAEVRDDLLGDAVILAILVPDEPTLDASHARGLLALKARRPDLLGVLVNRINQAQRESGELAEIVETRRGAVSYFTRRFPDGSGRLTEFYVLFPDGVFAFSNAESPIQEAIDRKAGDAGRGPSFAEAAGFVEASQLLADRPIARAFISPALLVRTLQALPPNPDPAARKLLKGLRTYFGAMDMTAAGLTVGETKIQLQIVQAFQTGSFERMDDAAFAPFRLQDERLGPGPQLMTPPSTAVAAAAMNIDFPTLYKLLTALVPDAERGRLAKLEAIASALLLGQNLHDRILPALGPRTVVYADAPEPNGVGPLFPIVAAIEINDEAGLNDRSGDQRPPTAAALENALKAALAALALESKWAPANAQVLAREGVVSLDVPFPFAFAIGAQARRLVVGSSRAAVARYLEAGLRADAGARFLRLREAAISDLSSYAFADLLKLRSLAARHKDRLVAAAARRKDRSAAEVAHDLDQILDLAEPFEAVYAAGRVDEKAEVIELRFGLVPDRTGRSPKTP
ncbi:hypothetical protein [Paludisphaera rhizosphaerae]|uniref:hypothetical protein n=1 Tax=Paludisphaera rhizosphaerae TaxID=2711216 RepID=UPI0013ED5338|nr:hypothetical protein [Paludisphaera rhizosphaerae]